MDFFYPLPNQGTLGERRIRRLPAVRARRRATGSAPTSRRPRGRARTTRCSSAAAISNAIRTASSSKAGNALTNLPTLTTKLNTASLIGGWTKILSPTMVNEMRGGYNYDNSKRQSTFHGGDVAAQLGIENAPSLGARPAAGSRRSSSPERRPEPADQHRRRRHGTSTARCVRTRSPSATTSRGSRARHTLKGGGLWTRNTARDGFGFGVNFRGQYRFSGAVRPATPSRTSCSGCRPTSAIR